MKLRECRYYEYECLSCDEHREAVQKFNDEPLSRCPDCDGYTYKLISRNSFILKRTGWYVTGYASSERKKAMERLEVNPVQKPNPW